MLRPDRILFVAAQSACRAKLQLLPLLQRNGAHCSAAVKNPLFLPRFGEAFLCGRAKQFF